MVNCEEEIIRRHVKLVSECFVKPNYQVEAAKQPYYLAPVDMLFLPMDPMQKGLLFNTKPDNFHSIQPFLEKLKQSLSLSLFHFYPLAGQHATHKFTEEHACWIFVDCDKGPGARLIHASVDLTVSDVLSSTDVHRIVRSFFDLGERIVNHDGHTRSLLSVQVTELLDGIFIGFTMNHSIVDGTTLWHFISTLSEIFLQTSDGDGKDSSSSSSSSTSTISISRKPIVQPFFPNGLGPIIKLPYLEPDEFITRFEPDPLRERIFHFSSKSISILKARANKELQHCGVHNINISSFQALSGFIWRSITRVRNLEQDLEIPFTLIANTRPRYDPPLSEDQFGNFVRRVRCECMVGQILGNGLGWATMLINRAIKAQDDTALREYFKEFVETPCVYKRGLGDPNGVLIAGSARFDMYGPEFGMGKAAAVLAGYPNKDDGKVTANPGREGGGSIDLEICLKPETMNALELDQEFMSFVSSV